METIKYKWLSFWMKFFGGHITIGNVTIFGANAMNWVVNIRTKKYGSICFTLPCMARFRTERYTKKIVFDWYFYLSPNGTPWASTYYIGSNKKEKIRAELRFMKFGHNFNAWDEDKCALRAFNDKLDYVI